MEVVFSMISSEYNRFEHGPEVCWFQVMCAKDEK